ncbi:MAG: L-seryl-tRNA(Sec) selenium transferase [Defluviicoccus sp.]|nr:L-seryl-tRNA(Sec) selenium transferase [Defluviicoccus sp.]MDE0276934.1 L-seryl-tRNA(Sec) selenium transferase [Defluviicoccus sp.]
MLMSPTMPKNGSSLRASIPSVDRLLQADALREAAERHGRALVVESAREVLDEVRGTIGTGAGTDAGAVEVPALAARIAAHAETAAAPSLKPVFNLTGTVLHTNLGRASLAPEAVEAVVEAAARPSTLEYDVGRAGRGDRDAHVEDLLRRLTGAEAATAVNNNAAAVLIVLSTLARGREVPVSRGELVEIGGSFRMPDVMAEAGCILREVGTTNRTHLSDFSAAIGEETALAMKVHASNYAIQGFTAEAPEAELAALCRERGIPFAVDLGSGALVALERHGLAHETTVRETLAAGADLVTFSGDKLLGGPQAGLIVGRSDLIARIKANPLKRALRLDKMTLAALSATLALYLDPDRIAARLPTLRHLTRPPDEIAALCAALAPAVQDAVGPAFEVETAPCLGQIGSGALPVASVPSHAVAIRPAAARGGGTALRRLAAAFAALPVPVIGRIADGALMLDLRCLDDAEAFRAQLAGLAIGDEPAG